MHQRQRWQRSRRLGRAVRQLDQRSLAVDTLEVARSRGTCKQRQTPMPRHQPSLAKSRVRDSVVLALDRILGDLDTASCVAAVLGAGGRDQRRILERHTRR